jgi:hypothetical protein
MEGSTADSENQAMARPAAYTDYDSKLESRLKSAEAGHTGGAPFIF